MKPFFVDRDFTDINTLFDYFEGYKEVYFELMKRMNRGTVLDEIIHAPLDRLARKLHLEGRLNLQRILDAKIGRKLGRKLIFEPVYLKEFREVKAKLRSLERLIDMKTPDAEKSLGTKKGFSLNIGKVESSDQIDELDELLFLAEEGKRYVDNRKFLEETSATENEGDRI